MIPTALGCLLFLLGGGEAWSAENARAEANRFTELQWVPVTTLAALDSRVLSELKARFGQGDRLADHDEPFNATDIRDARPSRRLVIAGHTEHWWFVCYEQGGRGHHLVVTMFDVGHDAARLVLLARGSAGAHDDIAGWKAGVSNLTAALRDGHLSVDDPAVYLPKAAVRQTGQPGAH